MRSIVTFLVAYFFHNAAAQSSGSSKSPTPHSCSDHFENDWTFKYEGQEGRGCGWVETEPWSRCLLTGVADACKATCCYIMPYPSGIPSSEPSDILSSEPSDSPSSDPSASPSSDPSASPSSNPSASPSAAPHSCSDHFEDDWTFKYKGQDGRGCGWVGNEQWSRCLLTGVAGACAKTCCDIMPYPSSIPSIESPSAAPHTCSDHFVNDWLFQYEGQEGRGCGWVETEPWSRCLLTGVADACKATCCDIIPYPSGVPSSEPSDIPSSELSVSPSSDPSASPSSDPSASPSSNPSASPSSDPSASPSSDPSASPSSDPSASPSSDPSASPSSDPSASPSSDPSASPSSDPSASPSSDPSASPSSDPSASPSSDPSASPSSYPSASPSSYPSASPSSYPSASPSRLPSAIPSRIPTASPSTNPSGTPTGGKGRVRGKGKGKGGERYPKQEKTRKALVADMQIPY